MMQKKQINYTLKHSREYLPTSGYIVNHVMYIQSHAYTSTQEYTHNSTQITHTPLHTSIYTSIYTYMPTQEHTNTHTIIHTLHIHVYMPINIHMCILMGTRTHIQHFNVCHELECQNSVKLLYN